MKTEGDDAAPPFTAAERVLIGQGQVEAHFGVATFSVCAAVTGALIETVVLNAIDALNPRVGVKWFAVMATLGTVHIGFATLYKRARPVGARWRHWAGLATAITFVEGLGWGWAPIGLARPENAEAGLLVMIVTIGVAAGALVASGRYLPTLLVAFLIPPIPYLIKAPFSDDPVVQGSFFLLLLFMGALGQIGWGSNRGFQREMELRMRNQALAADLRRQKEIAERANVAKSMFLASASHDLRQPVHALGLYVGALRGLSLSDDGVGLVDRIDSSIRAMDQLFSALLDLSQLDAGIVEVSRRPFAVKPFLERVCRDYVELALAKGLALRVAPSRALIDADPVLLERILRNLISNAIRYTDRGHILIGCRRRAGRLALQVWDTGRGIPADQREAIFQEYYQIGNAERDREKGLGLGLAIVRRLAALLACELSLRSEVGKGSCFEVSAPLAPPGAVESAEHAAPDAADLAPRGLVVVVDDEEPIRVAMARLLGDWGYETLVASSEDELMQGLARRSDAPALILCDHRLRDEQNGVEVVERIRMEYNEAIPAIIITGDTAPDRLAEAQASGLLLLHKPVPNGKLRAAISNLIARRPARLREAG
jgi:signal transduction histidine kinase/CheY-like chemotaxis protein